MIDQSTLKSIEDLHRLKTDGVITEEEFERSKERLLFGGRPKVAAIGDIASTLRGETVPRPADDDHIGWTTLALRRFTDFEGRSSRKEFWMFQFIYVGLILVMFGGGLDAVAGTGFIGGLVFVLAVLSLLALTVPLIAVQVRRLHDLNRSGWLALINLVPYVGSIVIYVLMLVEGTPGDNRFGPDPRQP